MLGRAVRRKEDKRFLTGLGQYVDDVSFPGMLHLVFVRSPHAHATVKNIEISAALRVDGVVGIFSGDSWPEISAILPALVGITGAGFSYCDQASAPPHPAFSRHITYVGEQVAAVVGETVYAAADGAAAVDVEYETLPCAADWHSAIRSEAPRVHEGFDNRVAHLQHAVGDVEAAIATADIVIERRFEVGSLKAMSIECRGVAARWDATTHTMEVWSTTQMPYVLRDVLSRVLGLAPDNVRVRARDIGGGFGLKGAFYPEDIIAPVIARRLGRPVRWSETRLEHMISSSQSGRQTHDTRVAATKDGIIQAVDVKLYKEVGAYNHFDMMVPTNTVNHLPTHYRIRNIRVEGWSIMTNTVPVSPYRGAGRVQAVFTMDRILDAIARATGLDPAEVRRRNIIRPEEMPFRNGLIYRDGNPVTYEGIDFPAMLEAALERSDYKGWRERQRKAREQGRFIGIGISSYVEAGGMGPCEGATVGIDDRGRVAVKVGVNSQGQSHETTLAQICACALDAPYEDIDVLGGDTQVQRIGFGTGASRVAINTGSAVHNAALQVRRKVIKLAAAVMECAEDEIEITEGVAGISGKRQQFIRFGDLAQLAARHPIMGPLGGPGLIATEFFYPPNVVWSSGVLVIVIEIDRNSGRIQILKCVFIHDSGKPLNPQVVDGQISGGFAQGIGIGIGEEMIYDAEGQALSGSLMDYFVPRAADIPDLEIGHFTFPTAANPLGIKSVGESGPNSPPAALAAAIEDALEGTVEITRVPVR